jgi:hypothetical protein
MLPTLLVLGLVFGLGGAGEFPAISKRALAESQPNGSAANTARSAPTVNVQLVCDSIQATKTKGCAFAEYVELSSPPKYYLREDATLQLNFSGSSPANSYCHYDGVANRFAHITQRIDGELTYFTLYDHTTEPNNCLWDYQCSPGDGTSSCSITIDDPVSICSGLLPAQCPPLPPGATNDCSEPWDPCNKWDCWFGSYNCNTGCIIGTNCSDGVDVITETEWFYNAPCNAGEHNDDGVGMSGYWVLSEEYTTAQLIQDAIDQLPSYPGTWDGTCSAYANTDVSEYSRTLRRFKYKFMYPAATERFTIFWVERFTPDDGSPPTDTPYSQTQDIGDTESDVFGPPPDPTSNGTITIEDVVAIQIVPAAGVAGVLGDMVTSNNGNTGENHFVSPPNLVTPGVAYLTFQAQGVDATQFANLYQWDGGRPVSGDPLSVRVARTSAEKTVLRILRKADGQEMAKLNVWIVSATPTPQKLAKKIARTVANTTISVGYSFTWVVAPAEILTGEHPALEGFATVAAPGGTNSCGFNLAGGVREEWDNSRQIRGVITNPNSLPLHCEDWLSTEFPNSNVEGNDDIQQGDETNNPYGNGGILTGRDPPFRQWSNNIGAPGNTIEEDLHFQEFVRLQIGGFWYRISAWQLWRADFKFIKPIGTSLWQDNGSDSYLNQ